MVRDNSGQTKRRAPASAESPTGDNPDPVFVLVGGGRLAAWKRLKTCFSNEAGFLLFVTSERPEEVFSVAQKLRPAVLIIEQSFFESAPPGYLKKLGEWARSMAVLVVVDRESYPYLERLLRLGCAGFVKEPFKRATLRVAVRAVIRGEIWASRQLISRLLKDVFMETSPELTERERQILGLISQGYKNQEIATHLCVTRETVRWHLKSLYAKIGVEDRVEAVFYARAQGYGSQLNPPAPAGPKEQAQHPVAKPRLERPRSERKPVEPASAREPQFSIRSRALPAMK